MKYNCKKCLLLQSGEEDVYNTVKDYIQNLEEELKVSNQIYMYRLNKCKDCSSLVSGVCIKCGCYVEIRAILKNKSCADYDKKAW